MQPNPLTSSTERRQDFRKRVEIKSRIRVVLTTEGHAYVNENAAVENLSEHGALLRLPHLASDHIAALAESPWKCTVLFDPPLKERLMFLSGDIAWAQVLAENGQYDVLLGLSLLGDQGRQHNCLCDLVRHQAAGAQSPL